MLSGSLDCNNNDLTCGSLSAASANAGTLTYDSSTITCSTGAALTGSNLVLVDDASSNFVISAGAGLGLQSKALTFNNLSITTIVVNCKSILSGDITVDGNFTMSSSGTGRIWMYSSAAGTQRTITCNGTVSITNSDFQDIVGAGSGTWSGTSIGNAGNNSGITFTTPTTCTWIGNDGNWLTGAEWDTGSYPLCHDTVIFNAGSFNADGLAVAFQGNLMPACDFSAIDQAVSLTSSYEINVVGSFISDANLTISLNNNILFVNRSDINFDPQSTINVDLIDIKAAGAKVTLLSALTMSGAEINYLRLTSGELDLNDQNVSVVKFQSHVDNYTRTLTMGNGTITLTGTGTGTTNAVFNASTAANLTVTKEGSTVILNNTAGAVDFYGGGKGYNNVTYTGNNIFKLADAGNSFATLTMDSTGGANTLTLVASGTQTVTSLVASGTVGNVITINSTTATNATISDSAGTNSLTYVAIDNVNATGGAVFNVDVNSTVGGDSTGWTLLALYTFNSAVYTFNEVTYTLND
jgi:hypothetical protein